jgi:peptidoglycan hydrolase CwlO-like protein
MEREIRRRAFAGTAGPRPTPRTILGGLSQFTSMSTRLVAKFEEDFDQTVANPLGEVDGTQINDQLLDRVRASEEALADLSTRAGERAAELRTLLQGLETAAKEAVTAAAEAAEEGAAAESAEPAKAAKPKAAKPKAAKPAAKAKPAKAHKSARSKGKPQPKAGKRQRRPIPA